MLVGFVVATLLLAGVATTELSARREAAPPNRVGLCGFGDTCRAPECHATFPPQSPTLTWDMTRSSPPGPAPQVYLPGEVFDLRLDVSDAEATFLGFELAAVVGCPFAVDGGALEVLEPGRTTLVDEGRGITYLTHSCTCGDLFDCCGFVPAVPFSGDNGWSFRWTAPRRGSGPVTFHVAFNSANGDGDPGFDRITTATLVVDEEPCSSPLDQPVADLRVTRADCGSGQLELTWTARTAAAPFVRATDDATLLEAGPAAWSLLPDACVEDTGARVSFFSVAEACDLGGEGPH